MKRKATSVPSFTPEAIQAMIDAAPERIDDPDCPYDPNDPQAVEAYWKDAVCVPSGGPPAIRAVLDERRRTRGPNRKPTKEQVSIRFSPEVLAAFRAGGPGWQTRMDEALKEWIRAHPIQAQGGKT